jgi:hypothetical protein
MPAITKWSQTIVTFFIFMFLEHLMSKIYIQFSQAESLHFYTTHPHKSVTNIRIIKKKSSQYSQWVSLMWLRLAFEFSYHLPTSNWLSEYRKMIRGFISAVFYIVIKFLIFLQWKIFFIGSKILPDTRNWFIDLWSKWQISQGNMLDSTKKDFVNHASAFLEVIICFFLMGLLC